MMRGIASLFYGKKIDENRSKLVIIWSERDIALIIDA